MKIYSHACEIMEILYTRLKKKEKKVGKVEKRGKFIRTSVKQWKDLLSLVDCRQYIYVEQKKKKSKKKKKKNWH